MVILIAWLYYIDSRRRWTPQLRRITRRLFGTRISSRTVHSSSLMPLSSITGSACRAARLFDGARSGRTYWRREDRDASTRKKKGLPASWLLSNSNWYRLPLSSLYSSTTNAGTDTSNVSLDTRSADPEQPLILCFTFFRHRLASRPWACSLGLAVPSCFLYHFLCQSLSVIAPSIFRLPRRRPIHLVSLLVIGCALDRRIIGGADSLVFILCTRES